MTGEPPMPDTAPDAPSTTFEDHLEQLGFHLTGATRRGGRLWTLALNRYVTFTLHDYHDHVVLTWAAALGDLLQARGWVLGTGELSFHEVYPANDVRLPADITAVEAELRRVLRTMQVDLSDPTL